MEIKDRILQEDLKYIAEYNFGLKDCTVFVTGSTGLIGSQIVKALLYRNSIFGSNIKVIALARNKTKVNEVFQEFSKDENLKVIYEDVRNKINIDEKVDFIIHGANNTASKTFVTKPVETIDTIISGTKNILEFAREKEVKGMIYLSSMEVFGSTDLSKDFIKEEDLGYIDILNVRSSYSEGKRIAETLCASYAAEYNVNVKIARLAQTFGAGIHKDDSRIFAQFARCVIDEKNIVLHTDGESIGNYCYIRDSIIAILTILIKGKIGEAYIVNNEKSTMSIKDMAHMVCRDIAGGRIEVEYAIPKDKLKYGYAPKTKIRLKCDKLKSLGWYPEVSINESYKRMINSMKYEMEN